MFVDAREADSNEYEQFWEQLRSGAYVADEFARISKGGDQV
jgi:methyl-accepting chemotaxis protein